MSAAENGPDEVFPGITANPGVRFGRPCVAGTRIDVATVVLMIADEGVEVAQREYGLAFAQVLTALRYAAHAAARPPVPTPFRCLVPGCPCMTTTKNSL